MVCWSSGKEAGRGGSRVNERFFEVILMVIGCILQG